MATIYEPIPDSGESLERYGKIINSPVSGFDHIMPGGVIALSASFTAGSSMQDIAFIPRTKDDLGLVTLADTAQGKLTMQGLVIGPNKNGIPMGAAGGEFVFNQSHMFKVRIADKIYNNSFLSSFTLQSKEISAMTHNKTFIISREMTVLGSCE